jgi:hypothetical protein
MAWKSSLLAFIQIGRKLYKMWADFNFARKEIVAFTVLIFTKLIHAERHHMAILLVKFHPDRRRNMEITGIFSFMPLSKICLSLRRFLRRLRLLEKFL